jgi:hypothetical protein
MAPKILILTVTGTINETAPGKFCTTSTSLSAPLDVLALCMPSTRLTKETVDIKPAKILKRKYPRACGQVKANGLILKGANAPMLAPATAKAM